MRKEGREKQQPASRTKPEASPPEKPVTREPDPRVASSQGGAAEPPFAGLKQFGENVYQTPAGAVLRLDPASSEVLEVVFDGKVRADKSKGGRLTIRYGDVLVEYSVDGTRVTGKLKLR